MLIGKRKELGAGVLAREERSKDFLYDREPLRIPSDHLRPGVRPHIDVSDRRLPGVPAHFSLSPISAPYMLAQSIDLIFGVAKHDGEHELSLGTVLEGERGESQITEFPGVQEVNDLAAIDSISGEPVWVPGEDAVGFAAGDTFQHQSEYLPTRATGTFAFQENLDDLESVRLSESGELADLGFEGDCLVVVIFGRFSAIHEISRHEDVFVWFSTF